MLRFGETERLDRLSLRAAAVGAVVAVVAYLLPGSSLDWLRWLAPAAIIAGTALPGRERLRGVLLGGIATLAYAAFSGFTLFADVLAGAVIGIGLTRHQTFEQQKDVRAKLVTKRAASVALSAAAWPLVLEGLTSATGFSFAQSAVPPLIVQAAAGGVAGLVMGLTTAPLFLSDAAAPVEEAMRRMQPTLDPELRGLVFQILETRSRTLRLIEPSRASNHARAETRRGLDAVAVTAIDLTNRFSAVDRVLSRLPAPEVDARIAKVQAQLESVTDPGVRRDLERTVVSLTEQRQQIDRLLQGRARLVARLQSEQAALEKTEMAFALLASGDAAIAGVQLETISSNLGRQAHEFEAEGSALQEMLTVAPKHALEQLGR